MKRLFIIGFSILSVLNLSAQKKNITIEDIWKTGTFRANGVYGLVSMNDGVHYSTIDDGKILQYEYAKVSTPVTILAEADLKIDGKAISIDGYQFSPDETKMLISTGTEQIYRHSTREMYYVYDRKTKALTAVSAGEKQMYATFSPDGNKVGFVRANNIFIKDLAPLIMLLCKPSVVTCVSFPDAKSFMKILLALTNPTLFPSGEKVAYICFSPALTGVNAFVFLSYT